MNLNIFSNTCASLSQMTKEIFEFYGIYVVKIGRVISISLKKINFTIKKINFTISRTIREEMIYGMRTVDDSEVYYNKIKKLSIKQVDSFLILRSIFSSLFVFFVF